MCKCSENLEISHLSDYPSCIGQSTEQARELMCSSEVLTTLPLSITTSAGTASRTCSWDPHITSRQRTSGSNSMSIGHYREKQNETPSYSNRKMIGLNIRGHETLKHNQEVCKLLLLLLQNNFVRISSSVRISPIDISCFCFRHFFFPEFK